MPLVIALLVACTTDGSSASSPAADAAYTGPVGDPGVRAPLQPGRGHLPFRPDLADTTGVSARPLLAAELTQNADIGTVATVRWATKSPAVGWVEITETDGATRVFPETGTGTVHEVRLLGLAAGTDFTWQAFSRLADGTHFESEPAPLRTPTAPSWLPSVTPTAPRASESAGGYVLGTIVNADTGVFMVDDQGRYVWWWRPADSRRTALQARLSLDGEAVLVLEQDEEFREDLGQIVRVGLDGQVLTTTRAEMAHHDFLELADGTYAFLAVDLRDWNTDPVAGDRIVILDPVTGASHELWSTWDDLTPTDAMEDTHFYGFGIDWTHANGLARDPATGDWLVSLHSLDTVVRLDPDGALIWQLGGAQSDFDLVGSSDAFMHQHSPTLTDAGVLLFNNDAESGGRLHSEAVEYTLDEQALTYTPTWTYGDADMLVAVRGSVERLPNGDTLIGWGSSSRITEIDPDNQIVWQDDFPSDRPLGFTHFVASLGEGPRP